MEERTLRVCCYQLYTYIHHQVNVDTACALSNHTLSTQVAQKRACPQRTNATPFRCPVRHTSQQSTACVVGACDAGPRVARDDVVDVMRSVTRSLSSSTSSLTMRRCAATAHQCAQQQQLRSWRRLISAAASPCCRCPFYT